MSDTKHNASKHKEFKEIFNSGNTNDVFDFIKSNLNGDDTYDWGALFELIGVRLYASTSHDDIEAMINKYEMETENDFVSNVEDLWSYLEEEGLQDKMHHYLIQKNANSNQIVAMTLYDYVFSYCEHIELGMFSGGCSIFDEAKFIEDLRYLKLD